MIFPHIVIIYLRKEEFTNLSPSETNNNYSSDSDMARKEVTKNLMIEFNTSSRKPSLIEIDCIKF